MKHGLLGSILVLCAGAGWAWAQSPEPGAPRGLIQSGSVNFLKRDGGAPSGGSPYSPFSKGISRDRTDGTVIETPVTSGPRTFQPSALGDMRSIEPSGAKETKLGAPTPDGAPCADESAVGVEVPDGPNAFEQNPPNNPYETGHFYPNSHLWLSADALFWWVKDGPIAAPLITSNAGGGLPFLGVNGTTVVGSSEFDYGDFNGWRIFGGWMNADEDAGIEIGGFWLNRQTTGFGAASNGAGVPALGRPVIDAVRDQETAELVAFPGQFAGTAVAVSSSRLWGAEANLISSYFSGPELLLGFRYLRLEEDLFVRQDTQLTGGISGFNGEILTAPDAIAVADVFDAKNTFYGGQVGVQKEARFGHFFIHGTAKVALGVTHETTDNSGFSTRIQPGNVRTTVAGGLLNVTGTSLLHSEDVFAYIPEGSINVGVDINRYLRLSVGYTFLYWSDVVRPGAQVNRVVNPAAVPTSLDFGSTTPTVLPVGPEFRHSAYWAQGFNVGVAIRY